MHAKYSFAAYAVDLAIFALQENRLKVLTVTMDKKPYAGKIALPGSLVDPQGKVEDTIARIIDGQRKDLHIEQVQTFGSPQRDPNGRVVSTLYMVLIPREQMEKMRSTVAIAMKKEADWTDAAAPKPNRFAYDHEEMTAAAIARLRGKVQYSTIIKGLMPDTFTLFDLKAAHEAILGKPLDKRNFIRHINASAILTRTGETEHSRRTRPAAKYRFSERTIRIISRM